MGGGGGGGVQPHTRHEYTTRHWHHHIQGKSCIRGTSASTSIPWRCRRPRPPRACAPARRRHAARRRRLPAPLLVPRRSRSATSDDNDDYRSCSSSTTGVPGPTSAAAAGSSRREASARPPTTRTSEEEEQAAAGGHGTFDEAVALFNRGEYHACHDVVEELWYGAEDPARTLLHGVLQCAVGFHHLFNQNHRGAMMELGEGLCKLGKLQLDEEGAFSRFRDEVAAVLQFLYRTQKELAACTDEMCLTMDSSPSSYQLLGNFAAGQQLYRLELEAEEGGACSSILFSAPKGDGPHYPQESEASNAACHGATPGSA